MAASAIAYIQVGERTLIPPQNGKFDCRRHIESDTGLDHKSCAEQVVDIGIQIANCPVVVKLFSADAEVGDLLSILPHIAVSLRMELLLTQNT